jgi:DNA helicase-4
MLADLLLAFHNEATMMFVSRTIRIIVIIPRITYNRHTLMPAIIVVSPAVPVAAVQAVPENVAVPAGEVGIFLIASHIENDPIMKLVTYEDNTVPYAEERRLFYVALTRTKNRVYLVAPRNRPSRFLVELVSDFKLAHSDKLNMSAVELFPRRCPVCDYPLKYEFNKNYGLTLYICTNEVEVCDFMTNHPRHLHDIFKCGNSNCDGYMIVKARTSDGKPFYGCTNFSTGNSCRSSHDIKVMAT